MDSPKEIYPKVMVYPNALKDHKELLQRITSENTDIEPWTNWYTMGRQAAVPQAVNWSNPSFPTADEWAIKTADVQNKTAVGIANAFYDSTSDYINRFDIQIENWVHGSPQICTHFAGANPLGNIDEKTLAMQYHTDLILSDKESPGFKHWITCNIYINDDYVKGGLFFKVFKNETDYDYLYYKPSAGDALVFPSHDPYYHGVERTLESEKFFVRCFWGYNYAGSAEWHKNKELYGEQQWLKMDSQRVNTENRESKWMKGFVEEIMPIGESAEVFIR